MVTAAAGPAGGEYGGIAASGAAFAPRVSPQVASSELPYWGVGPLAPPLPPWPLRPIAVPGPRGGTCSTPGLLAGLAWSRPVTPWGWGGSSGALCGETCWGSRPGRRSGARIQQPGSAFGFRGFHLEK